MTSSPGISHFPPGAEHIAGLTVPALPPRQPEGPPWPCVGEEEPTQTPLPISAQKSRKASLEVESLGASPVWPPVSLEPFSSVFPNPGFCLKWACVALQTAPSRRSLSACSGSPTQRGPSLSGGQAGQQRSPGGNTCQGVLDPQMRLDF